MAYKGVIKKSKTMDYAAALAVAGAVLQSLPELRAVLQEHYGLVLMALSAVTAWLRVKTTQALKDKE